MSFIREIAEKNITDQILEQFSNEKEYKLIWKEDSVEVWGLL